MTAATPELNDMVTVLRRAGWNCAVTHLDFLNGTTLAILVRVENGGFECVVSGEGADNESADRDLPRNWAAGKGMVPAVSSPEELELKLAAAGMELTGREIPSADAGLSPEFCAAHRVRTFEVRRMGS